MQHRVMLLFTTWVLWANYQIVGEPITPHRWFYVGQYAMEMYALCSLLTLLRHAGCRHQRLCPWLEGAARSLEGLFVTVTYITAAVEAFLYARFYLPFNPAMMTLLLETNGGESREFLTACLHSPKLLDVLMTFGGIAMLHILSLTLGSRLRQRLNVGQYIRQYGGQYSGRTTYVMSVLALVLLGVTLCPWLQEKGKMASYLTVEHTTEIEKVSTTVFYSPCLRLIYSTKFCLVIRQDKEEVVERMLRFESEEVVTPPDETAPTIVVIIGESYNKHHASCYGYDKPTTPKADSLVRRGEMTVFTDAVTPWNITSNAFKDFLSTHSTDQPGTWTEGVLLPAIFRKGGYRVSFITNQFSRSKRQNRSDLNGSFFLNDARLDSMCFDYRNRRRHKWDNGMLDELKKCRDAALADPQSAAQPQLYLIHLMGQHLNYAERCPEQYRTFRAADYDRSDLGEADRQIIADYDNATCYNDKVVGAILSRFQREDAVVICFADHGEEVFDGEIGMYGRNHNAHLTPSILHGEFEVPLLMLTSRRCRRLHPELAAAIRAAADRPFSTDDLPHLLLGISRLGTRYYDPRRDLLSPEFNHKRPRPVKGTCNYDDIIKD